MKHSFFDQVFRSDKYPPTREELSRFGRHWGWMMAAGIGYVILGVIAFSLPVLTTVGLTLAVACLLLASGVVQTVHAIRLRKERGAVTRFFQSLLALIAGVLMLRFPGEGILTLALILSFYFIVSGTAQWMLAMALRPEKLWMWGLVSSICSFALGLYMVFTFPFSAIWIPGVLLAVDLVISGAMLVGLSWSVRKIHKELEGTGPKLRSFRPSTQMG
ncbi:MAG: HdeD family acid-resistance protein [Pseudobdellovibrionaceae bacterium]